MPEVEMKRFYGYHMQSNGVICKKNRRGVKLSPKFIDGEYRYHLIKNKKRFNCNAYKLFYAVFSGDSLDDLPEGFWDDKKFQVFPINGYPMDFRIENLELVCKQDILNRFTKTQINDIVNVKNGYNTTIRIMAAHLGTTENTIRFIIANHKASRGPKTREDK